MRFKKGMILKSKSSNTRIVLVNKKGGMGHWNTQKLGSKNSHKVHEGTLRKFYAMENE